MERVKERNRELFESFSLSVVKFEFKFKITKWLKNSEILNLRSFFNELSGKNIKPIYLLGGKNPIQIEKIPFSERVNRFE
jgi:hypothetical protein